MSDQAVIVAPEGGAVAVFNPLDAQPIAFKQALQSRQENYDNLAMHLRGMLVLDKDFGQIHVMPKGKCPEPWSCTNASHYSKHQLFAAGADKVLGMLGLGTRYPGEEDLMRAAMTGKPLLEVILKCQIVDRQDQVIAEGMGACAREEMNGSLNNTVKRAAKRARVDAVMRLPSISALFETDFLAEIASKKPNSTSERARKVEPKHNTGAKLTAFPFGKNKGVPFTELEDGFIDWGLRNLKDKPDVIAALEREHRRRYPAAAPESKPAPTAKAEVPPLDTYEDDVDDEIPF